MSSLYSAQARPPSSHTFFLITNGYLTWKALLDHIRIWGGSYKEALQSYTGRRQYQEKRGKGLVRTSPQSGEDCEKDGRTVDSAVQHQHGSAGDISFFLHELKILLSTRPTAKNPAIQLRKTETGSSLDLSTHSLPAYFPSGEKNGQKVNQVKSTSRRTAAYSDFLS